MGFLNSQEKTWCRLPEFIDIEKFITVCPCIEKKYKYSSNDIEYIGLRFAPSLFVFTIAKFKDANWIQGTYDFTPLCDHGLHAFLQLYWKFVIQDILIREGFSLRAERHYDNSGTILMEFVSTTANLLVDKPNDIV